MSAQDQETVIVRWAPPLLTGRFLVPRIAWWRYVAEPRAVQRVHGAQLVEPVIVGRIEVPGAD